MAAYSGEFSNFAKEEKKLNSWKNGSFQNLSEIRICPWKAIMAIINFD